MYLSFFSKFKVVHILQVNWSRI